MYVDMPVAAIERNPDQPRKHFDTEALAELAQSIKVNGLLEPIVVRPVGDAHQIIAGERRWRASQIAGLETVPVRIMEIGEVDAFVLSVAENVNRADMTVMEESEAFATLARYGKSADDIAQLYGKTKQFVEIRLSFLNLTDEAQKLVAQGTIRPWLARFIADLSPANQRTVVNKWARGEFQHEDDASYFARALKEAEEQEGFFALEPTTVEEREEHARQSRKVKGDLDKIDRLASLLTELADADPNELAAALGAQAGVRFDQIDRITKAAKRAHLNMRRVKAAAAAREVAIREDIVA